MNGLDISADGSFYVSCSTDRSVKLWHYDEGVCWYTGDGHSSAVNKVKISPDERRLVSIGESAHARRGSVTAACSLSLW